MVDKDVAAKNAAYLDEYDKLTKSWMDIISTEQREHILRNPLQLDKEILIDVIPYEEEFLNKIARYQYYAANNMNYGGHIITRITRMIGDDECKVYGRKVSNV